MPKSCSVRACRSRVRRGVYLNRFFQFPSDPERRRLWASRCGNGEAWLPISKHVYVCADHFVTGEPLNNRGHPDYAPSLLLGFDDINKLKDVDNLTESLTRPKEGESSREIIKYDEYFEGGIPDSLLEGLGFSETEKPAEEDEEEFEMNSSTVNDVVPLGPLAQLGPNDVTPLGHLDVAKMLQFGLMTGLIHLAPTFFPVLSASSLIPPLNSSLIAVQSALPPQNEVLNLTISQNKPSYSNVANSIQSHVARSSISALDLTAKPEIARPATVSSKISSPVNHVKRLPSVDSSTLNPTERLDKPHFNSNSRPATQGILSAGESARSFDSRSSSIRQITKGNIMYERLPTGEVVASVIKKPEVQDLSAKDESKVKRTQSRVVQQTNARHNQISISNLEQCPSEYPVNEHNIMDVLEQSIQATHSMRLLLMTLRDDLRRTGGSNSSVVTGEQARKRREVAIKLSTAYATYKESIDNIENARFLGSSAAETKPESVTKPMASTVSNSISPENCTLTASGSISNRLQQVDCAGNTDNQTSNSHGRSSTHGNVTHERVDENNSGCTAITAIIKCDRDLQLAESCMDVCDNSNSPSSLHIDET